MGRIFKSISGKFSAILALFLVVCMGSYIVYFDTTLKKHIKENVKSEITSMTDLALNTIQVFDKTTTESANKLFSVLEASFEEFSLLHELPAPINGIKVPAMLSGSNDILNENFTIVDKFTKLTGATATVFLKKDDDFLRISTSLRKEDGSRAFGTFLGKKSPAYQKIMNKQSYVGVAHLFGKDYMTRYSPILDKDGSLIGILYMGYDYSKGLNSLKKTMKAMAIGEKGYFYVLDTKAQK